MSRRTLNEMFLSWTIQRICILWDASVWVKILSRGQNINVCAVSITPPTCLIRLDTLFITGWNIFPSSHVFKKISSILTLFVISSLIVHQLTMEVEICPECVTLTSLGLSLAFLMRCFTMLPGIFEWKKMHISQHSFRASGKQKLSGENRELGSAETIFFCQYTSEYYYKQRVVVVYQISWVITKTLFHFNP